MRAKYYNYRHRLTKPTIDKKGSNGFWSKTKDPLNLFTAILAVSTILLTVIAGFQWRTLEKTDQTIKAQERAFLYVETFNTATNGNTLVAAPVWKNSGSTPATSVQIWTNKIVFQDDIPPGYGYLNLGTGGLPNEKQGYYFGTDYIGPQSTMVGIASVFSVTERPIVRTKYIMYGWAKYMDAFGGSHLTRFCYYLAEGPSTTFLSCSRYACTDSECN
jgi:hypothetical protein